MGLFPTRHGVGGEVLPSPLLILQLLLPLCSSGGGGVPFWVVVVAVGSTSPPTPCLPDTDRPIFQSGPIFRTLPLPLYCKY